MAAGRADSSLTVRLERTVAWMDAALAALQDGVALVDAESSAILFVNEAFAAAASRERIFLLGAPLGDVLRLVSAAGAPLPQAELPWCAARRGAAQAAAVFLAESPGGRRHVEVAVREFAWTDAAGRPLTHLIVTRRDVTERRRAEEGALLAKAATEAANTELEAFCWSVAHDLRVPLRIVEGFSQLLFEAHAEGLGDEGRDTLRRIQHAGARMGLIIEDLLRLSRVTRGELRREPVDLSALAREAAAALQAASPGRQVEFAIAPGLSAEGDAALLRLALENLLANAWKFTGGRPKAFIEFGRFERDGRTAYGVRDDGAGFDMAYAPKLFTPFGRLHTQQEFEGTGIGLATVARIIARHGGRVWAEGAVGKGAAFYFTLWEPA